MGFSHFTRVILPLHKICKSFRGGVTLNKTNITKFFEKKIKKSVDTYSVYVVYLGIRFREKRRMLTKTNHLLSLMAFREIKS